MKQRYCRDSLAEKFNDFKANEFLATSRSLPSLIRKKIRADKNSLYPINKSIRIV
jgi:hypothetical protein